MASDVLSTSGAGPIRRTADPRWLFPSDLLADKAAGPRRRRLRKRRKAPGALTVAARGALAGCARAVAAHSKTYVSLQPHSQSRPAVLVAAPATTGASEESRRQPQGVRTQDVASPANELKTLAGGQVCL
jgi:hypothetical protein